MEFEASDDRRRCPYCAEVIQPTAAVCRHCHRNLTGLMTGLSFGVALTVIGVVIGVIVFLVVALAVPSRSKPAPLLNSESLAHARSLLAEGQQAGYITRFTCIRNEVAVMPRMWITLDAEGKRGLTLGMAGLCEAQNSGRRMTVIDAQSGRRLASYHGGTYQVF